MNTLVSIFRPHGVKMIMHEITIALSVITHTRHEKIESMTNSLNSGAFVVVTMNFNDVIPQTGGLSFHHGIHRSVFSNQIKRNYVLKI